MPKTKTTYVVIESYTDEEGDAVAELLYAGESREAAIGAVKAFEGQPSYHEWHAQVAVQSYPDSQDADDLPYAIPVEVGHEFHWKVQVGDEQG